ncbi:MAG: asparagine synthetase B, partial [Agathobacter sp.]|nr:asparagine synthetase B [Agathobacter sp.]
MQNLRGFADLTQPLLPSLMLENCYSHPSQGHLFSLSIDGSCFHTREQLLTAYHKQGPDFIRKENGHFAIALWDGARKQLLLYRDRSGVKPCFYLQDGAKLAFASLPWDLFSLTGTKPRLDKDALLELLAIGPARVPGYGLFENVKELLPGQYLIFSPEGLQVHTYWTLEAKPHEENYQDTCGHVAHLLEDAIGMQISDGPTPCSLLSGGIDSSIVTAIASKHPAFGDTPLSTFSFDFTENTTYFAPSAFQPEQDTSYIARMLQAYPLSHTSLECPPAELATLLPDAMKARNYPGMADVDASLLFFCTRITTSHRAALTGECADEIFGGYPWYYKPELFQLDQFPWSWDYASRCSFLNPELFPQHRLEEYSHHHFTTTMREAPVLP